MKKLILPLLFMLNVVIVTAQETDSIIDIRDGHIYKVVKVGQQWWLQKNLNIGTRIDGGQDAADNGIIEKYCFNDIDSMCNIYGGLYQWDEMMQYNYSDNRNPGITQGICPIGWHLPTDNEWTEIIDYMGGDSIAGGKLKETGTVHWNSPNTGAVNESNFTALAGGCKFLWGHFSDLSNYAYFWSSTEDYYGARFQNLSYSSSEVSHLNFYKELGFSVRCLRDTFDFNFVTLSDTALNPVLNLNFSYDHTVEKIVITNLGARKTIKISSIHTGSLIFNINVSALELAPGDSIHLVVSFNPSGTGLFTDSLTIESDDPYNSFISVPLVGSMPETDSIIDIRDGQKYTIVKIGQQWWMQENLNIGIRIDGNQDPLDNGMIEKYCYDNDTDNCNIYGGLYQWNEMMDYNTTGIENPVIIRGVCPVGWHIPIEEEWNTLINYLGGYHAGIKMKAAGSKYWTLHESKRTNESGFTAYPGGVRDISGSFYNLGDNANFWSTSMYVFYELLYYSPNVNNFNAALNFGFSVRCLRDSLQTGYLTVSDENLVIITALDFYGKDSSRTAVIINSGLKTIHISSIDAGNDIYHLNYSSVSLMSGDSIHLIIRFNPPSKKIYSDTLYIISDDTNNPMLTIPLNGTFPPEMSFTDIKNVTCNTNVDGSFTIIPSLGIPPYSYLINPYSHYTTDSIITDLRSEIYYVTLTDSRGFTVTESITIHEPPYLLVTNATYSEEICENSNNGYIYPEPEGGIPPYSYLWSNGQTSQNLTNLDAGLYSVIVTDSHGCTRQSMFFNIANSYPDDNKEICIVTTDLLSGDNLVVWEEDTYIGEAYYNIYREDTLIGTISYDNLNVFRDTLADSGRRSYSYRLSYTDTCGSESYLSQSHKPIFLQYVNSINAVNLIWNNYEYEGGGQLLLFDSYTIYRGSDSSELSPLQEDIPLDVNVYMDTDPLALQKRYYYCVAGQLKNSCYPISFTKSDLGSYTQSMSNLVNNHVPETSGKHMYFIEQQLVICPNPFTQTTTIMFPNPANEIYKFILTDISGKQLREINSITSDELVLDRNGLPAGLYLIELRGFSIFRGKILIE